MSWWPPVDVNTIGGIGPQMNKFEQVSDDHQMSVTGGEGNLTCDLSHDIFDVITPPTPRVDKQTPVKTLLTRKCVYGFQN